MTKKEIIKEVATSLYLLIMFSKPAPGVEWDGLDEKVLDDTRAKAEVALKQAERVIGPLNVETVKEFMATRDEKFIIDCGGDVVVGDKIRFTEDAFDNRHTPSLFIGKRTVVAEVKAIEPDGRDMSLTLRIIRTSGSWPLAVGSESPRILQYITKFGISRIA